MPAVQPQKTIHYTPVAKFLHWAILALVVVQFLTAWLAPEGRGNSSPSAIVSIHMSFGILILALMAVRFVWRMTHPVPPEDETLPHWQHLAARLMHFAFYASLIALPLLGWIWASSRDWTVNLFGVIDLPALVAKGSVIGRYAGLLHSGVATLLLALIGMHVLAALYHHHILQDDVLKSMMPTKKSA